jgi:hypothetical protein
MDGILLPVINETVAVEDGSPGLSEDLQYKWIVSCEHYEL